MIRRASKLFSACACALRSVSCVLFLLLILVQSGRSQSSTDGLTPPSLTPGSPAGSYSLTDFENVNLFNGNLNFHLPLVKVGGRGGAQSALVLKIETRWRIEEVTTGGGGSFFYPTYNWWSSGPTPGYGPGRLDVRTQIQGDPSCDTNPGGGYYELDLLTFTTGDGTEYELRDKLTNGMPLGSFACFPPTTNRGLEFVTTDGTSALFVADNNGYLSGYLILRDGTRYQISAGLVTDMRDRNGNKIHYDYDGNSRVTLVTDSLGRTVTIAYDQQQSPYGLHDKLTYTGAGGFSRVVRVSRAFLSTVLRSPFQPQSTFALFPELSGSTQQGFFDAYVVSAVWLPNGKAYNFLYNSYGELARVLMPTGGAIEYDWDCGIEPLPNGSRSGVVSPNIYRRVIERRTYPNGATGSQYELKEVYGKQEYIDPATLLLTDKGYVTVDQDDSGPLSRMKHYFYGYGSFAPVNPFSGGGIGYTPWKFGKEYQTESLDSGGTTLRRTNQTWEQREAVAWWGGGWDAAPPNDPRITAVETTLADISPNKVSKKVFAYSEDAFNNQIAVEEFDYGSGSPPAHPIRRTETAYVQTSTYLANSIHLVSLPADQRVYALDSNGEKIEPPVATTQFFYDQSALVTRSGIVGLDSGFSSTKRGNVTTTTQLVDGGGISTSRQYDVAGNVVSVTDPLGRTTTIEYADSYADFVNHNTFALPTSSTSPIPDSGADPNTRHGSNTAFTTSAVYEYNSGLPVSFTDANGKTTTYLFNDSLDRLTKVTRPAGAGSSTYTYGDNAGNLFVHSATDLDATRQMESSQYFDGLGRTVRSFTYDGTAGTPWIVADTHYDGVGRVVQVSNPYRVGSPSSSVPACGTCTTTGYDILGRVHTVTLPDGSIATTDYSNNTVTTTDPASRKRNATSDGLGRMITVVENPGGTPSYTTSYVYDLLNNLRKVTQGAQTRFFNYDAVSRLRREWNPEQGINTNLTALTDSVTQNTQWSVEYVYNNNGNLTKKTDPRNVSINLGYDALNRPITRTYSDSTPPVDYLYDGARVGGGIANSKGRKTGALTSGAFTSSYTYDSFDDLGRVLHTTQTTDAQPYQMSYQYNLAGLLISETYPSNKTFATTYDIAGRIAGVTGPSSKVYADSFTYTAHGAVSQMRLGNQLWEHANFNNRFQPTEIGIGTGQSGTAGVDRLKLNYEYGATDNNGNVKNQTITVPTVSGVTGTTLNQCYTYDEFNRLKIAEEKTGASPCQGTTVWTQKFKYDQQGNRQFDTGTTIPVSFPNVTINTANNNRIDGSQGYLYDFAGNVTQDPSHSYAFDAEERQKTLDGGATGQYFYDGNGQRVKTITGSGTTLFVYDAMGKLVAEYTSGNPTGTGTSYVTTDGLGSPRVITAQDKSVRARHDYLPFGEEVPAGIGGRTAPQGYVLDTLRQKFTGKERDVESGLDYFGARYYSSRLGRFNGADSMFGSIGSPQTLNRYAYTLNNPLKYVDPTGHNPLAYYPCDYYDDAEQKKAHNPERGSTQQDAPAKTDHLPPAIIPAAIIAKSITVEAATIALAVVTSAIAKAAAGSTTNVMGEGGTPQRGVSHTGNVTPVDLYIFSSIEVKAKDIAKNEMNNVDAQNGEKYPEGKSSFADLSKAPLTGRCYMIPKGSALPPGINVKEDGRSPERPDSPHAPSHHTLYPTVQMPFDTFNTLVVKFVEDNATWKGKK